MPLINPLIRLLTTGPDVNYINGIGNGVADDREALANADLLGPFYGGHGKIYRVDSDITFLHEFIPNGSRLRPNAGVTITLGPVNPALEQFVDLSLGGSVVVQPSVTPEAYPEWWGARADGATNSQPGWQAAINSGAPEVVGAGGTYFFADGAGCTITHEVTIRLRGKIRTTFSTKNAYVFSSAASGPQDRVTIEGGAQSILRAGSVSGGGLNIESDSYHSAWDIEDWMAIGEGGMALGGSPDWLINLCGFTGSHAGFLSAQECRNGIRVDAASFASNAVTIDRVRCILCTVEGLRLNGNAIWVGKSIIEANGANTPADAERVAAVHLVDAAFSSIEKFWFEGQSMIDLWLDGTCSSAAVRDVVFWDHVNALYPHMKLSAPGGAYYQYLPLIERVYFANPAGNGHDVEVGEYVAGATFDHCRFYNQSSVVDNGKGTQFSLCLTQDGLAYPFNRVVGPWVAPATPYYGVQQPTMDLRRVVGQTAEFLRCLHEDGVTEIAKIGQDGTSKLGATDVGSLRVASASAPHLLQLRHNLIGLTPGEIAANSSADVVASCPGVTTGQPSWVIIVTGYAFLQQGLSFEGWVTGTDEVTVRFHNNTAAPLTPTPGYLYNITAMQFEIV